MAFLRAIQRKKRHERLRKKLVGTTERPRLSVYRSNLNLSAQIVDDYEGKTLLSGSTLESAFRSKEKTGANLEAAKRFGHFLAEKLQKKGVKKIVFDRGGYAYHGRIKAFADSLREKGIEF
ncbi:MAG: 50S ribosomal protein L18 [Candidatus Omnitrophica bacterium CG11_big_fil_rev_8_21_14_0_20_45_26]|uniref:Large ribosomal subunit protein uL18 n=1 Tax=Candidatus Abzuiibacterium crystallinum TaxID=1974748 RepID=A0A2H0LQC9_9BACT|nr:MAG: 50S ribosomal protein L18 [Candidatus Omnitrophica bacterium CG11_big_fil_rev_8_21_14_0_20_45_26]PIW65094.1 MAG: 50S ribosomal protein L18 [Candidatus Omnitrophica bacterium CG12_big_fil_rev_8_21_14_0_65_45_16]